MREIQTLPSTLNPQPVGGYTVTSSVLPWLITEGDNLEEVVWNACDVVVPVHELRSVQSKPLPADLPQNPHADLIRFEYLIFEQ